MFTLLALFVLAAFIITVLSAMGKCPLWIAVVLLCVVEAAQIFPLK
jgi:hypothetical protein